MVDGVLNDETVLFYCYRELLVPQLLTLLGRVTNNILAIGKKECWLINARTAHKGHFIGTKCETCLYDRPR